MSGTKDRKPLKYITYYYAMAAIQIVMVHSRLMHVKNTYWVAKLVDFLRDYDMALFFFISGVLLSYTQERHDDFWKWYKNKLTKVLCPYLILTILAFVPKLMLEPILHNGVALSFTYIIQLFFYPRKTIWGHFWFVPVYLLVMPLCFWLIKKCKNRYIWIILLVLSACLNYHPIEIGWFGIKDICRFLFYTFCGIMTEPYINKENIRKILGNWKTLLLIIAAAAVTYHYRDGKIITRIHSLVMITVFLSLSLFLERYDIAALKTIGKNNFTIYVYSWPTQAVAEIFLTNVVKMDPGVIFVIKLFLGMTVPLILIKIADKCTFLSGVRKYLAV